MADIKVLSTNGVATALKELAPQIERASGHKLSITLGATARLKQQIGEGAAFDVAILTAEATDDLIKQGKIAGARVDLAKSGVGVAVRAGARKPDIGTAAAFKRALLEAKSVAYSAQGMSGIYFASLLERLGIADEIKAKGKVQQGVPTGEATARGEAELAIQQISELKPVAGIEIVGPFPAELQLYTVFSAGLGARAAQREGARALIDFLSAQMKNPLLAAKGLEPA
jgi:molybdate transport system substrate-binding protein